LAGATTIGPDDGAVPVYCINLDRRPDRLARMQKLARARGFELTRVAAFDAADPANADTLAAMPADGPTGRMGAGTLACTRSHARAWRALLDSGAACAVILEDDLRLAPDFSATVAAIARAPDRAGLVKLEEGGSASRGLLMARRARPLPLPLSGGRGLRRCYQLATDAGAYLIDAATARQALARIERATIPVDHFLFYPLARRWSLGCAVDMLDAPIAIQDRAIGTDIGASRYTDTRRERDRKRIAYELAPLPMMLGKWLVAGARVKPARFSALPGDSAPGS
jgi:glycosyl transferase, family 25